MFTPQTDPDPTRSDVDNPVLHPDHAIKSLYATSPSMSRSTSASMRSGHLARTTSSAMHSIMEQGMSTSASYRLPLDVYRILLCSGGLVEISPDGTNDRRVLTRTIGDPSTGTDPTPSAPLTTPDSSPVPPSPPPPIFQYPSSANAGNGPSAFARPQYVELPARPNFIDGGFGHVSTPSDSAHSTASASTPGTTASRSVSPSPGQGAAGALASTPGSAGAWEAGMRVLVVDDDPLTRKLMSRMLTRFGCRVSTAENGEIALDLILGGHARLTPSSEGEELAISNAASGSGAHSAVSGSGTEEYKYAVVFLDNQMPVLSGLDVVRRLRELGRKDFVVGVTGALTFHLLYPQAMRTYLLVGHR